MTPGTSPHPRGTPSIHWTGAEHHIDSAHARLTAWAAEPPLARLAAVLGLVSTDTPPTERQPRDDEDDLLGPWTITVIVSASIAVLSVVGLVVISIRRRRARRAVR